MILKELLFSECAIATGAFSVGCMARAAGFKLLDDAKKGEFDNILFGDKEYPSVPHSPLRYATAITFFCSTFGVIIYDMTTHTSAPSQVEAHNDNFFATLLMSATAGVCFSAGARLMFECSKKRVNDESDSTRRSYAQALALS